MEGQEDAQTSVQETNILHVNSDIVCEIGFLPNTEQPSVTHTKSNRQAAPEAEHTNVLHSRYDDDSIELSDNEIDNGTSIKNIEEYALPEIQVVANPTKSGNH